MLQFPEEAFFCQCHSQPRARLCDGFDVSVGVIKKAQNLVSHVNSSIIATEKIKSAQLELSPSSTALKLVSDCETKWWSTNSLVERTIKLKQPLLKVFEDEYIAYLFSKSSRG
jgi:hypothetical protein